MRTSNPIKPLFDQFINYGNGDELNLDLTGDVVAALIDLKHRDYEEFLEELNLWTTEGDPETRRAFSAEFGIAAMSAPAYAKRAMEYCDAASRKRR